MKSLVIRLALLAVSVACSAVYAWDGYGHMSVAYVAYQKLTPQTRAKANALLKKNPDYPNWVKMMPSGASPADKNLMAFMVAATWPDRIKKAPGYHEDNPAKGKHSLCGAASSQNVGFNDHFRHRCWHFVDVPFTQDNTPHLPATPVPNAEERIALFRPVLSGNDDDLKAYDLPWVLHLVGDLHQPLHCTTRVRKGQLDGDAGGNSTKIKKGLLSSTPLHSYWDDVLGTGESLTKIIKASKQLPAASAMPALDLNVNDWVNEGVALAKNSVYVKPIGAGGGPFKLTQKYKTDAKTLAKERVALGGERLANLLNAELK
jgi:hypothetical protein